MDNYALVIKKVYFVLSYQGEFSAIKINEWSDLTNAECETGAIGENYQDEFF